MRKLLLMRHARAEAKAASGEDHDRGLTRQGLRDAAIMGELLAASGLAPDLALVSSAERARQTWAAAAAAFGAVEVRYDRRLYNAGASQIRDAVDRAAAEAEVVMVVGHNPGMPLAMLELIIEAGEPASVLERARSRFPTSSVAVFDFDEHQRPRFANLFFAKDHGGGGGE